MNWALFALLISNNPRKRKTLMNVLRKMRERSMRKWKWVVLTLLDLYFFYLGGSLTVKNSAGAEVQIDDPSLTDTERLRAISIQNTRNSNYERFYRLVVRAIDIIFDALSDPDEIELFESDLFGGLDYVEAPDPSRMAALEQRWGDRYGIPSGSSNGAIQNPNNLPQVEVNRVPGRRGGAY